MKPTCTGGEPIPSGPWDVVVVGAGAAGLMTCLELPSELRVLLVNRNTSRQSSSRWAQGGIASVTRSDDSSASHAGDTLEAGAGLCDGDSVRLLVTQAPHCVARLQTLGMEFDHNRDGSLATTLEAAHSHHRVLHVQDRTGHALVDVLRERAEQRAGLLHRRGVRVSQLWVEDGRCCGVQVLDGARLQWIRSRAVVLATGGGGHLYTNTTNPAQETVVSDRKLAFYKFRKLIVTFHKLLQCPLDFSKFLFNTLDIVRPHAQQLLLGCR